jgi:hypothetical protein
MKIQINKYDKTRCTIEQTSSSYPIIRAGIENIFFLLPTITAIILAIVAVDIFGYMAWVYSITVILLFLKSYDRYAGKIIAERDRIAFICPLRIVTIPSEDIQWIKVKAPLLFNSGNIFIIIKRNDDFFPRIFHITTHFLGRERFEAYAEIKKILERPDKSYTSGIKKENE